MTQPLNPLKGTLNKVAFLKNKNRNDSISIGASVLIDELKRNGITVDICDYRTAFDYKLVLVSMTATEDIIDLYGNMHRSGWEYRTFTVLVGGFGCQNPWGLARFADYAWFGRADGLITEAVNLLLAGKDLTQVVNFECVSCLSKPRKVKLRQVNELYPHSVNYGKNNSVWTEKFVGCPHRCKFCHYSWNRKRLGGEKYINDGLSAGSPEVMLYDVCEHDEKFGRFTTGLDGYSERLRFLFGKRITWDLVEQSLDHVASFRGNTYIKMYNIHNFPTETDEDRQELFRFFAEYAENSMKPDGVVTVEFFNTAFRPSLNTPMQRLEATLYPPARYEDGRVAIGDGFVFKMSVNNRDALSHLEDLISIRYQERDMELLHYIATDKTYQRMNNSAKMQAILGRWNIENFVRRYDLDEYLPSDWVDIGLNVKKQEEILRKKLFV